jgi:hypothetical protein
VLKLSKLFFIILSIFIFFGFWNDDSQEKPKNNNRTVTTEISKKRVETGEVFSYLITIEGEFNNPKIEMPALDNFKIISTKKTKSFSYQQNKLKANMKITYFLSCPEPGSFTIEPVKVSDDKQTYQSNSLKVTVTGDPLEKKKKIRPYIESGITL